MRVSEVPCLGKCTGAAIALPISIWKPWHAGRRCSNQPVLEFYWNQPVLKAKTKNPISPFLMVEPAHFGYFIPTFFRRSRHYHQRALWQSGLQWCRHVIGTCRGQRTEIHAPKGQRKNRENHDLQVMFDHVWSLGIWTRVVTIGILSNHHGYPWDTYRIDNIFMFNQYVYFLMTMSALILMAIKKVTEQPYPKNGGGGGVAYILSWIKQVEEPARKLFKRPCLMSLCAP